MSSELWSVEYGLVGFEGVVRAFKTYLHQHRSKLALGQLDALSDDTNLPPTVEAARREILRKGEARQRRWWRIGGDPQMAIQLDLGDPREFELFETFGAYSIDARAYFKGHRDEAVGVHDSGSSLFVLLDKSEVEEFRVSAGLPSGAVIDLESSRQRAQEQRRRRQ